MQDMNTPLHLAAFNGIAHIVSIFKAEMESRNKVRGEMQHAA